MYRSIATKVRDLQYFTGFELGTISNTFCADDFDPQDAVADHPSEVCEVYNKNFFCIDPYTMTCLTATPDLDDMDTTEGEDARSDNHWYSPGEQRTGHAMAMGLIMPEEPAYDHSGVTDDLYERMFGAGRRGAVRVIDWYGEKGGTEGVLTQYMSRLAFVTIGDGVPLLLACQDSEAGIFRIIGRGVNALLRFPDYGSDAPEDGPSAYVFVAIPPGASAPETYDDALRKMSSPKPLDQREEGFYNRVLRQMHFRSNE